MTRVVHCKREPYDVYIGRPSVFGNPFPLIRSTTRQRVINQYAQWVEGKIVVEGRTPPTFQQIKDLKGKTLGCWCAPLACHGDILVKICEESDSE